MASNEDAARQTKIARMVAVLDRDRTTPWASVLRALLPEAMPLHDFHLMLEGTLPIPDATVARLAVTAHTAQIKAPSAETMRLTLVHLHVVAVAEADPFAGLPAFEAVR